MKNRFINPVLCDLGDAYLDLYIQTTHNQYLIIYGVVADEGEVVTPQITVLPDGQMFIYFQYDGSPTGVLKLYNFIEIADGNIHSGNTDADIQLQNTQGGTPPRRPWSSAMPK